MIQKNREESLALGRIITNFELKLLEANKLIGQNEEEKAERTRIPAYQKEVDAAKEKRKTCDQAFQDGASKLIAAGKANLCLSKITTRTCMLQGLLL